MNNRRGAQLRWFVPWPWLAIISLLTVGWFIYRPALGGTFLLDDHSNLAGLQSVSDLRSAVHFVLSGDAGPLGRPIALASFLPHAAAWGSDATPFIRTNILIHLFNGLLVFLFAGQLGRTVISDRTDAQLVAFGATAVWLLMPLLASSSLLIVQRMTTLSATFVLCGLAGYMAARRRLDENPRIAMAGMTLALLACTLSAVLTKENGALLPTFILVIEATLLGPPRNLSVMLWNTWRGIFLAAPTVVIIAFLLTQAPYSDDLVARRGFTAAGRLLGEARVLWEYLINAFYAPGAELGPFHESRKASAPFSDPLTLAAVISWILTIAAAVLWRRRYPVAAFAVLWFIAGHLLESTTVPLELYFEHRNYLPIIGPVFALCYFALRVPGRLRLISRAALAAYAVVNAGILLSVTSLWGNPLQAATAWHEQDPDSVRAATTLASRQLATAGPEPAIATLRDFAGRNPGHAYIRIPELSLYCMMAAREDHSDLVEYLDSGLRSAAFSFTAGEMLDQLLTTAAGTECDSVPPSAVADLAAALMENPRYGNSSRYNRFHHMLMARIARASGDTEGTLDHLARAIGIGPGDDLNMMTVSTLVEARRFDAARSFIAGARDRLSPRPLRRYIGLRNLDELLLYVNEMEELTSDEAAPDRGD
jgi:hypothetical protein